LPQDLIANIVMEPNPLKWPQFEQLGRDFYDALKPTIDQLNAGADKLDDDAQRGLTQLQTWLESPCVATVKLDGTNVGVSDDGLVVGRNTVVGPGETYQKTNIWALLEGYPEKAAHVRSTLVCAAGGESVGRTMLYGELVVNSMYNYAGAGIFKQWLCFGVVVRPDAEDPEAPSRLASALQAAGFNARGAEEAVVVAPNAKLASLLNELQVLTVAEAYTPAGTITAGQWAEHDGKDKLPRFHSLRQLLLSKWAQRFLLPADGVPLGEGLVVASEADGRLFKWKHGGEELGKVPEQLHEAVEVLRSVAGTPTAELLPPGLLEVFERLLLVASTKPAEPAGSAAPKANAKAGGAKGDSEAVAAWESALTKFDSLDSVFERGQEAQKLMQVELIEQVAKDLVKDYGASEKDSHQRAKRIVLTEMGKQFGIWKKALSNASDS